MKTFNNISGTTQEQFSIKNTTIISGTGSPTGSPIPGTLWIGTGVWVRETSGWQLINPSRVTTLCDVTTTIDFDKASHHTVLINQNTTIVPIGTSCRGMLKLTNTGNYNITINASRPSDLATYVPSGETDILSFINFDSWLLTSYIRGYV